MKDIKKTVACVCSFAMAMMLFTGCSVSNNGSDASSQATPLVGNGNCPVQPIETLTTINQWE
ncbi:MAG: hypothetical protein LBL41_04515, partial [Bifidobacteriaceae bacterium]|nr:hypothetical protein [Bifidobacteriaceae bacterium]